MQLLHITHILALLVTLAFSGRPTFVTTDFDPNGINVDVQGRTIFTTQLTTWTLGDEKTIPATKTNFGFDIGLYKSGAPLEECLHIRITVFPIDYTNDEVKALLGSYSFPAGETDLTLKEICDPQQGGKGILMDSWAKTDRVWRGSPRNGFKLNTDRTFTSNFLLALTGEPPDWALSTQFDLYDASTGTQTMSEDHLINKLYYDRWKVDAQSARTGSPPIRRLFAIDDPMNDLTGVSATVTEEGYIERALRNMDTRVGGANEMFELMNHDQWSSAIVDRYNEGLPTYRTAQSDPSPPYPKDPAVPAKGTTNWMLARYNGLPTNIQLLTKVALVAIGAAMQIVGFVFCLIELVGKQWLVGVTGLVSEIGGALLAFIAGIFKVVHKAKANNPTEIVRYAFFGDARTTGDENCQKQHPKCTALYGPGTISAVLGMHNFDTIMYLIHHNEGKAMAITDMAKTFHINGTDEEANAKAVATIKCNNKPQYWAPGVGGKNGGTLMGDNPTICNQPTFAVNRALITLPGIGQTADKVIHRMIGDEPPGAPSGDCKIVTWPGIRNFPNHSMTIQGSSPAIACNLTNYMNIDGNVVPVDSGHPNPRVSNGSTSTDGVNGAYVPPPDMPKGPGFQYPLTPDKSVCISSPHNDPLCLPNGTYNAQTTYDFSKVNAPTLCKNCNLTTNYQELSSVATPGMVSGNMVAAGKIYTSNIAAGKDKTFDSDMKGINNGYGGGSITILTPSATDPVVVCLFSQPNFFGDVLCLGQGGGALPDKWQNKAQSIKSHNGAWAFLFMKSYTSLEQAQVQGDTPDLATVLWQGTTDVNFSKKVVAIWVQSAQD